MHPALSVIFFTSLSGAGYGLFAWLGILLATGRLQPAQSTSLLIVALLLGMLLTTIGLLCSLGHLGKPQRAWRAFSQWRTSWLSREGVLAVLVFVPAIGLLAWLAATHGQSDGGSGAHAPTPIANVVLGFSLSLLALLTVACTAMIYASLTPIPAWRHRLVLPGYLGFSMLTGGWLWLALSRLFASNATQVSPTSTLVLLASLALLMGVLKLRYWHDIDRTPLPATRGAAVGLPGRDASVFERPHTESNYLTREMAFVVARTHARRMRLLSLLLIVLVPLGCMTIVLSIPTMAAAGAVLATITTLAGVFLERWLFFAQAKHMVTLYY